MVYGMNRAVQDAWIEAYPAFFRAMASAVGWRREAAHRKHNDEDEDDDEEEEEEGDAEAEDEVQVPLGEMVRKTPQPIVGADEVEVSLERGHQGSRA